MLVSVMLCFCCVLVDSPMCYVKRTHFMLLGLPSNYKRQIHCLLMSAEGRGSCTIMKMEVLENGPSFSLFMHPSLLPAFP